MDHLCYLCLVFFMLLHLFIAAFKLCHFSIGILGQVRYLIVLIPDFCTLTYFVVTHWERADLLALVCDA